MGITGHCYFAVEHTPRLTGVGSVQHGWWNEEEEEKTDFKAPLNSVYMN